MKLLVTGGAGYVGSVCSTVLLENGHDVVVVDDLSTGNADAVPPGAEFIHGDIADVAAEVLGVGGSSPRFDGVLHFGAQSLVGESVESPEKYWQATSSLRSHCSTRCGCRARRGWSSRPPQRPTVSPRRYRSPRMHPPGRPIHTEPPNSRSIMRSRRMLTPTGSPRPACATSTWPVLTGRRRESCRRNTSDPTHPAGRTGATRAYLGIRDRLADQGRHRDPRLHPRQGPSRRALAGAGECNCGIAPHLQPRQRRGLHRARGHLVMRANHRAFHRCCRCPATRR